MSVGNIPFAKAQHVSNGADNFYTSDKVTGPANRNAQNQSLTVEQRKQIIASQRLPSNAM
jgi:hypothetical protein